MKLVTRAVSHNLPLLLTSKGPEEPAICPQGDSLEEKGPQIVLSLLELYIKNASINTPKVANWETNQTTHMLHCVCWTLSTTSVLSKPIQKTINVYPSSKEDFGFLLFLKLNREKKHAERFSSASRLVLNCSKENRIPSREGISFLSLLPFYC